MTTPTILSDIAAANPKGARVDRSGAVRSNKATASVPSGTTTSTIVGMIRFEKGASIQHLALNCAALGTSVTIDMGVVYDDSTNNTDAPAAFLSANTLAAAGGSFVWPVASGLLVGTGYVTTSDGWIVVRTGGATTGSTGNVVINSLISYDA